MLPFLSVTLVPHKGVIHWSHTVMAVDFSPYVLPLKDPKPVWLKGCHRKMGLLRSQRQNKRYGYPVAEYRQTPKITSHQ